MAYARLNADFTEVTFSKSKNSSARCELKTGEFITHNKTINEVIAKVPVSADFSKIPGLTLDEATKFRAMVDTQIAEVNDAFSNNARNGIFGGYPVVKRSNSDDIKYANYPGYKAGRTVGEFLGVIAGAKFRSEPVDVFSAIPITKKELTTNSPNHFATKKAEGKLYEIFNDVAIEICEYMATTTGHTKEALTEDEIADVYRAERIIYLMLTLGTGYLQSDITKIIKKQKNENAKPTHDDLYNQFKKSRRATRILGSQKKIPEILAGYDTK